ncbi:ketopantoate reductase family protein [Gillisia sp. CAL575]|uniref:ketopantoate reductase family protein n=1 Tax=Gillisia sp. CAL575 TaxID=985255 RepID=UPI0003A3DEBB|nr:2-dehydropantoate 2-reductase [Gillisia sp. CAL575]
MRILIYGAGGIGGYFGGRLAQSGNSVSIIARGKHLEAIKKNGLEVESINGDFTITPSLATDNVKEVETPELIILGVKSWQIPDAANELKSIINENSMVLPLQNGASNVENLMKVLPETNILGGLCHIVSFMSAPGLIKHAGIEPKITFGELDNSKSARVLELEKVFSEAEITNIIPEDITLEVWKKFLFITTISALGGLTRVSLGEMRESSYLMDLMRKTAEEIKMIANAKGIALNEEHLKATFEVINKLDSKTTASTQRDIMEGKPSELENFNGYIVKQGNRLGIPTPVNQYIYECLLPMEKQARMLAESR